MSIVVIGTMKDNLFGRNVPLNIANAATGAKLAGCGNTLKAEPRTMSKIAKIV